jgi:hypothetical protein
MGVSGLPTSMILAYLYDFLPKFHRGKNIFFLNIFLDENNPLNRFIHSKMQNYVCFCLIFAPEGEQNL